MDLKKYVWNVRDMYKALYRAMLCNDDNQCVVSFVTRDLIPIMLVYNKANEDKIGIAQTKQLEVAFDLKYDTLKTIIVYTDDFNVFIDKLQKYLDQERKFPVLRDSDGFQMLVRSNPGYMLRTEARTRANWFAGRNRYFHEYRMAYRLSAHDLEHQPTDIISAIKMVFASEVNDLEISARHHAPQQRVHGTREWFAVKDLIVDEMKRCKLDSDVKGMDVFICNIMDLIVNESDIGSYPYVEWYEDF